MPKPPGRDLREPMERLVRMAAVLWVAGKDGVDVDRLADVGGYDSEDEATRREQVARDLRHLTRQGWRVDNLAGPGERARYRMTAVDNRLAVRLTRGQSAALQRAAMVAERLDLIDRLGLGATKPGAAVPVQVQGQPNPDLDLVLDAVRHRCLLRFRYKGRRRTVHPQGIRRQGGGWYLSALEVGGQQPKYFVVSRMSEAELDGPGTADVVTAEPRTSLDPLSWRLDPPTELVVRTEPEFRHDVLALLGRPVGESRDGSGVVLTFRATNWDAVRARLYELGLRVDVLGSPEFRAAMLEELRELAAGGAR